MRNLTRKLFTPPIFEEDEDKTRSAELLNAILFSGYLFIILILVALLVGDAPINMIVIITILLFSVFVLHLFLRKGYVQETSIILVVFMTLALTVTIAIGGSIRAASISFYILASIVSGLLISTQALYWSAFVNTIIVFILLWAENTGNLPDATYAPSLQPGIIFAAASMMTALLLSLALNRLNQALRRVKREKELAIRNLDLEKRVKERTAELERNSSYRESAAEVSRAIASLIDTDELIWQVVNLIKERFNLYYVGLFLVDSSEKWAILRAGTGEAGKAMLENEHRLKIGEGMIGWCIANAKARIALDVGEDAVRFDNPHLPETHSEGALPLRSRGQVLGALTIQSREKAAFTSEIITILQTMVDQIAIAIDNAQLLAQNEAALKAERKAYGELSREDWLEILQRQKTFSYLSNAPNSVYPIQHKKSSETLRNLQEKRFLEDDGLTAFIPIKIRGYLLGGIRLRKEKNIWTKEQLDLAETLASQISISLESARLFDQSQRRAVRERIIGQAGAKMRETLNIESVLETAAKELHKALGGMETKVWIAPENDDNSKLRFKKENQS